MEEYQIIEGTLSAPYIKIILGQIKQPAISITFYKVKICIIKYEKFWSILELFITKIQSLRVSKLILEYNEK